jgi:hypothetical protein
VLLIMNATILGALLAAFLANPDVARDPKPPSGVAGLARWIAAHPADWLAASALTDQALDSRLPRRFELWHAAYAHGRRLAPQQPNARAAFVRSGLMHWSELGASDRRVVLAACAPLLRDPAIFDVLRRPLWQLTRNFGYLRRNAPRSEGALGPLRDLALANGLFADYRELREELRQARLATFRAKRSTASVSELLALVPQPIQAADEPLVREFLEELDRRSFELKEIDGRIEPVAAYALAHGLQPLAGMKPLIEEHGKLRDTTRARLARALGDTAAAMRIAALSDPVPERKTGVWEGMCSPDEVCRAARKIHDGPIRIQVSVAQSDQVPPYVEIYTDDALVAEGEVTDHRTFVVSAPPGRHHTEVRLANPRTKTLLQRRIRLSP